MLPYRQPHRSSVSLDETLAKYESVQRLTSETIEEYVRTYIFNFNKIYFNVMDTKNKQGIVQVHSYILYVLLAFYDSECSHDIGVADFINNDFFF